MSDEKCEVEGNAERDIAPGLSMAEAASLSDIFNIYPESSWLQDLFDRLSLKELFSLRETCKRIKQVVDYYIRINLPAVKFGCSKVTIRKGSGRIRDLNVNVMMSRLHSTPPKMSVEKRNVLANVESITIYGGSVHGEFYYFFLKFCTNLKLLYLERGEWDFIAGTGNEWLLRKYPTIEHIVLDDNRIGRTGEGNEVIELKTFFELNRNIRIFSTTIHYLWENRRWMIGSHITFDRLDIVVVGYSEYGMRHVCGLLNELHKQGFYKRLHFYGYYIDSGKDIEPIFSLHALEKLHFEYVQIGYIVPPLPGLKELSFHYGSDIKYAHAWASNPIHVERIRVKFGSLNDIMSFIRHSKNVREIKIDHNIKPSNYSKNGIVNVRSLNRARERLAGAKKIIIYVEERIFLNTKWTKMGTIFPLIELKRAESMETCFSF